MQDIGITKKPTALGNDGGANLNFYQTFGQLKVN